MRTGLAYGWKMFGVRHGHSGLVSGDFILMEARDVGGIIQRGGTILGSTRCPEFKTDERQLKALAQLHQKKIEGLIVIGGAWFPGGCSRVVPKEFSGSRLASTIDNDLYGSEITIGVNTALNVALEVIDRLKITASSSHRAFLVEVMGRPWRNN